MSQVCQGGDQGRAEDEHVVSPSFLADHPPGCAHSLLPRTSSSPPSGSGALASFPLYHELRGHYTEGNLDSRAYLCLDDAGQDIVVVIYYIQISELL